MYIGIKVEMFPDAEQTKVLEEFCLARHNLWNYLVQQNKNEKLSTVKYGIRGYSATKIIHESGIKAPYKLAEAVLLDYKKAKERFFNKTSRHPKFHKYNPNKKSFYLAGRHYMFNRFVKHVTMPKIAGFPCRSKKILLSEKIKYPEVREPVFMYEHGRWYFGGVVYIEKHQEKCEKNIIGLDWGIRNFMTTSDGAKINYPKSVKREYQRIQKLQSILSKKQNGSNNYKKIKYKLLNARRRFKFLKKNFIEETTTRLCKENSIAVEKLDMINILNMSMKNIRRLNIIHPYNIFITKLQWKCEKFGSYFYKVDPKFTSMTCSNCGNVKEHKIPLNIRVYHCEHCGSEIDRDINAARNIAALAVCGS